MTVIAYCELQVLVLTVLASLAFRVDISHTSGIKCYNLSLNIPILLPS